VPVSPLPLRLRFLALWAAIRQAATGRHVYLSTGCLHGDCAYCKGMTGVAGVKRPGECKGCEAHCICPCHRAAV
jgi:hypothetical protein